MDIEAYIEQARNLSVTAPFVDKYYRPKTSEYKLSQAFTSASAAMRHLLPHISFQEQEHLLSRLDFFIRLQNFDENFDLRDITTIEGNVEQIDPGHPHIFCTFHYGSYRNVAQHLAFQHIKFSLLLTRDVLENQATRWRSLPNAECCEFLAAEDPLVVKRCISAIRSGRSILVYVDGNSGVGGETIREDGAMVTIPFLGGTIHVRHGIYALSRLSGLPIVPLINVFDEIDKRRLLVGELISCPKWKTAHDCMESVFSILAEQIKRDAAQWEGWIYYSTYIKASREMRLSGELPLIPPGDNVNLRFNHERFGVVRSKGCRYLLDKNTLAKLKLNEAAGDILDSVIYARSGVPLGELLCGPRRRTSALVKRFIALAVLDVTDGLNKSARLQSD